MKKDITILLTGVGGPGAPGMIKCYRNNGERNVRMVGVDMNENAAGKGLVDAFYSVPRARSEGFIPRLLEICEKEKVDVVVPIVTKELESFSNSVDQFAAIGTKVSVMQKDLLYAVNDKGRLLDAMQEKGMPTAKYYMVETADELFSAIEALGYPKKAVCIKATDGNGSRGIRMLDTPENDYKRFFSDKPDSHYVSFEHLKTIFTGREIPRLMVMELLPGTEYSIDAIANETGPLAMVCRRGLKVVSSNQVECIVEKNEAVEAVCRDVIREFGLVGQFGFDLKCDANEVPYVLEINPRLTAGIVACAAAGCNLPYLEVVRLLGEEMPDYQIHYGTLMTRHWEEDFFDPDGNKMNW